MKRSFQLKGLDCPNCAAKLEQAIAPQTGVKQAVIDFPRMRLTLEAEDDDFAAVMQKTIETTRKIEPETEIVMTESKNESHEETESVKSTVIRIFLAIVLLIAVWLISMPNPWKAVAYAVPYLIIGYETLVSAAKKLIHGELLDESFLMSAATLGAFAIGEYPEAAGVMIFFEIGEVFEHLAVGKSRRSIAALMDIRPDRVTRVTDMGEETISPENIRIGDVLRVRAGEKIALDGTVLEGETTVHTAALTGESVPVEKRAGDTVLGGTVNLSGVILMRADCLFAESTAAKMLDMVEHSAERRADAERFISRFARRYTPIVVICAILLGIFPPLLLGQPWTKWLRRACMFLMVSCPCALVVSVPLSFFGGIGGASRCGILIKGADYLEKLASVDALAFDKTGTLTRGSFEVNAVHPAECTADELLEIAAAAEHFSTHPVAESILRAHGGHLDESRISETEEVAGLGIHAVIDGKAYDIGNERLMTKIGVSAKKCHHVGTMVHLASEGTYLGHIVVSDVAKTDASTSVSALNSLGIKRIAMLSGDSRAAADEIAERIGITEVRAELLPAEKCEAVRKMQVDGCKVAYVGDGINDAPVLMQADLGIAMGALGSDAAMEAADVVLMDDKLGNLPRALQIARKTMKIVRENIVLALTVKAVILVLSAAGLTNMWLAMFGDVGVLMLAVLNALRCMGSVKR